MDLVTTILPENNEIPDIRQEIGENLQHVEEIFTQPPLPPTHPNIVDTDNNNTNNVVLQEIDEDGVKWEEDPEKVMIDQNGPLFERPWSLKTSTGDILTAGCELGKRMTRLDYFLLMFPPGQILTTVRLSNNILRVKSIALTTSGELLRYFGICILSTRYEFASRRDLWSTTTTFKYQPPPAFGKTGMPRNRFDLLWQHIQWSEQPSLMFGWIETGDISLPLVLFWLKGIRIEEQDYVK